MTTYSEAPLPRLADMPTLPLLGADPDEIRRRLVAEGLRLSPDEAKRMLELLGRDPTRVEATIFDTMWSEHCSYKSSRRTLQAHLPTKSPDVILGPGEDAGVVRFGTHQGVEYALVLAHESHNHPSQVVPVEGAATGIGGIVRDVNCMGAEVIGVMDALRFGDPEGPRASQVREIVRGVVDGIWQYANALGVPNVGGDVFFSRRFDENCLVNVVALVVVRADEVVRSRVPDAASK
jgi:phosphoribosylformylglycinamidine (FGAM) synthase-like enzyme